MATLMGLFFGFAAFFVVRYGIFGFYTVAQNERAVKTRFGRALRVGDAASTLDDPAAHDMTESERERYDFPQVRVIPPGGPYFKMPWERIHKVSVATETVNMAYDPESASANHGGTMLEAVTKDQLNTGLTGQIRYQVSERYLYPYLFGVKNPLAHVMGFFISVLRGKIAQFEAPASVTTLDPSDLENVGEIAGGPAGGFPIGVSINDLRKNLRDLNDHMIEECRHSALRYGIELDASLITGIDPPQEVESALAAINTAYNQVSSDISLAQASADQKLVQSRRAVEIETLHAQAEVEPLEALAEQLRTLEASGGAPALRAYVRNVRLGLYRKARNVVLGVAGEADAGAEVTR